MLTAVCIFDKTLLLSLPPPRPVCDTPPLCLVIDKAEKGSDQINRVSTKYSAKYNNPCMINSNDNVTKDAKKVLKM
jgi:hypothetical protein